MDKAIKIGDDVWKFRREFVDFWKEQLHLKSPKRWFEIPSVLRFVD